MNEKDMVNHPDHYQTKSGLEAITVIEAFTEDLQGIEAVDTGNALKYLMRWKNKNGIEDLRKAKWYIDNLISHLEKKDKKSSGRYSGRYPWDADETFAQYDSETGDPRYVEINKYKDKEGDK